MEIKKSPKADLQNKRGLLREIGLIIALGGVIAAFAWTPKEQKIEKLDLNIAPVEEEIMEITRQEQKPPESPKKPEITVITDILKVVTNDTKITTNVDFAEFEDDVEIVQQVAVEEEEIVEEQPFRSPRRCLRSRAVRSTISATGFRARSVIRPSLRRTVFRARWC